MLLVFAGIPGLAASAQQPTPPTTTTPAAPPPDRMSGPRTSMIAILADPARFDGQRVQIVGFVHLEFEGSAVYLHREDFEHDLTQNGLALASTADSSVGLARCQDHYAFLDGVVHAADHGHMGQWTASLHSITRCAPND